MLLILGRGPVALARSAVRNVRGVAAARAVIASYRPSVVLATGGYASVPVVVAARLSGVPSAVFLPDVEPGLAVKALSRVADRVACSVEVTRRYLSPAKVVRRTSRTSVRSKRRARCIVARLSHMMRSWGRHACE